ncbi:hypothetical protein [Nostocoides vanveenii]|uniref:hypothetical protein n=1 Tax=Nostocoides vanveenii TaxID=330835 RepID=UPI0031E47930
MAVRNVDQGHSRLVAVLAEAGACRLTAINDRDSLDIGEPQERVGRAILDLCIAREGGELR